MRFPFLLALFMAAQPWVADAQMDMFQRLNVPVKQNGQTLKAAFAGGINNAQLSAADLNNDGVQDLVVFDRAGDYFITYLNDNLPGEASYTYAPEYACNFPKLIDWVLLRDYNQDGAADIFCGSLGQSTQEVQVFRGYYENNMLHFTPFIFSYPGCAACNPQVIWYADDIPGFWNNLPICKTDIPAIDDVDSDGDLDLLVFPCGSSTSVWWFKNSSVEEGFGLDSLHFAAVDQCWGNFYENGLDACQAILNHCVDTLAPGGNPADRDNAHPGATLTTYDQDFDGDKELIIGNVSFSCLSMLTNGGTPQEANMIALDTAFVTYDVTVDLANFPAAFYLDIDNDGKKDLVVTPNNDVVGEDQKNVWFYKNTSPTGHQFELQTKSLLTSDMLDLGSSTHPVFADVNADGLWDLVVGNYGYFTPTTPNNPGSPNNASLYLYLNKGTPGAPLFELEDADWLGHAQYAPNDYDFAPAFGDLDGDTDLDLVIGSNDGGLYFYRNAAGPGNPMILEYEFDAMWTAMDIGTASTPALIDLDLDGRMDIVMGERAGNINFFKNNGSSSTPVFASLPTIQNLGAVDTDQPGQSIGFSTPVFIPTQNDPLMLTGTQAGNLELYDSLAATTATFPAVNLSWGNLDDGNRTHPALADIDEDGILEMVIGNQRGGLSLYKTVLVDCSVSTRETNVATLPLSITPNPASSWVRVSLPTDQPVRWQLFNTLGQRIDQGNTAANVFSLPVEGYEPGVYLLEVLSGGRRGVGKVVVRYQH